MSDKDAREEAKRELLKAVTCLHIAVESSVAADVERIARAYINAVEATERTQAPSMALEYEPKSDIQFQWCNSMRHDPNIGYYVQRLQAYAPFELARILESYSAGTQAQAAQWISVKACSCCGCPERKCIHDDCSICGGKWGIVAPVAAIEGKP